MLKDRRNSSKPTQYPRQAQLPSPEQLREIYQQSVKSAGTAIELPFGDNFVLSVARKTGTGGCEWVLYRREEGGAKLPEWTYESTDPRWIHLQIMACFPNWSPVRQYTSAAKGGNDGWVPPPPEKGRSKSKHAIMEGEIANVSLKRLLGSIGTDRLTGQLEIHPAELIGTIYVNDGRPVHCQYGKYEGKTALRMLLKMTEAKFFFYSGSRTERVSLPRDLEAFLNPSTDGADRAKRKRKPKREGVNAVIFGESDDDDDDYDDEELDAEDNADDEFEDETERIVNPLYVEGKPALLGQNSQGQHATPTDGKSSSNGSDSDGSNGNAGSPHQPKIYEDKPVVETASGPDTAGGIVKNRTDETQKSRELQLPGNSQESADKGEPKKKLNPFEHLSLKMSGRVPVPTPRRNEAAEPPPRHHALANDNTTTFARSNDRAHSEQTGDQPRIGQQQIDQKPPQDRASTPQQTETPQYGPQREVLRPEDFLQQPPPESLKEPVVDQAEETPSQQPHSSSSEHGVQNQLSQQIAVPPDLAPALQQAMSIQRLPAHLQHNHPQPNAAPQSASQVAPNPLLKSLNSLMPQILPANQAMPPLPVQQIAAPQQQSQATPENPTPVHPTTAQAAAPPAMAPSAWRGPDPQKDASAPPESPVKPPSDDSRNDWLDDIVIDDEDAAGEKKEYTGPKATTAENQEPAIDEAKPTTQTAEQANAMLLMQKTLHEIPASTKPEPTAAAPPMQRTMHEIPATSKLEPTAAAAPPMQQTMHEIPATSKLEPTAAAPPMQRTMYEIPATSKPEPTAAAAPPMQRTMYEIPASAQPAMPGYDQAETPAVVQPAPPASVESVIDAPIPAAANPAQKAVETPFSPTEIALRHQAEISNQAKGLSNSSTALPAVPHLSQREPSQQKNAQVSRWPDHGISLMNGPDAPGYSKKERFQVRMSLVNRSTQMMAYPVLMYMTEMEFVRAARYNRALSMIVIQVGTKANNNYDSPVEALDIDGMALLGTKIMDIKRSPDLLGHFDPDGMAILDA